MHPTIKALIEHYHFTPLPVEGTLFVSTWRSKEGFPDGSPVGTSMLGLYANDPPSRSFFHRLPVDEVWHFYSGDPLRLVLLHPDGSSEDVVMGSDTVKGQCVQFVVPADVWQAGHLMDGGTYALFGCTMAPGFTGKMYEGGLRVDLLADYPDRRDDIITLTSDIEETRMPEGFAS